MKVNIVFEKQDGTVIPFEEMTEEEKKQQAKALARRFMETMGYEEVHKTA